MVSKRSVAAYILAGGQSSRMARDKALLEFGGSPLVLHIAEVVKPLAGAPVIVGPPQRYPALNLRILADDSPGLGPLGGISTALRETDAEWNLILGCDLPFLTSQWLAYLIDRAAQSDADAVVPYSERGAEPLCAMYRKRCAPTIAATVSRGVRKVTGGLAELSIARVEPDEWKRFDAEGLLFKNLNSSKDLEEIADALERKYGTVARP
jgi:molybdenum cofactor guanylyltransferase